MSEPLKPVSDKMRAILALLGETPQEHQEQVKAKPKERSHKLPPDAKLTPSAEIAARWESQSWRPIARVLFVRQTHCKRCNSTFLSPHWPETFIQERLVRDPKAFRYLPSRSSLTASLQLPQHRELVKVETYACHLCPDWQQDQPPKESHQCLEDLLLSRLAATESSPSKVVQISNISLVAESSSLSSNSCQPDSISMVLDWSPISSVSYAPPEVSDGRFGSLEHGFASASYVFDPSALARHTTSPTTQDKECVSVKTMNPVSDWNEEPV